MAEQTGIEWTHHTFNPWWGCERVSPACAHCYAADVAVRYQPDDVLWAMPGEPASHHGFRFFGDGHWGEPLRWNRKAEKAGEPALVFCASMADVFESRPELVEPRERLWELIEATPWLTWQLLTKRPGDIINLVPERWIEGTPPNVWLGTSIENTAYSWRAVAVTEVPAPVHFLSCEPLLGSLFEDKPRRHPLRLDDIEWVIGGGESGPKHRLTDPEWARELRDECIIFGIPFFWKQWGGVRPKSNGKAIDGAQWCQIPTPLSPTLTLV